MSKEDRSTQLRTRRSTMADVATLAKVDRSVVSRLVSADPRLNIRESTRQRVLKAIEALNYRPNAAARALRTSRARALGLFIPDFANPAYAEIIRGAEVAAAAAGSVLVAGSDMGVGRNLQAYLDLLGHGRVDGVLLATGALRIEEDELTKLGAPWLFVNRTGRDRRRYVVLDDEGAIAVAVNNLVALGHKRLAHLSGPRGSDSARRRRLGYQKAVRERGIGASAAVLAPGNYTAEGGSAGMTKLLSLPEPPTAVVTANVASAIGALHAANSLGVRVPEDLSVIAVHDIPLAAQVVPALTTVRTPLERLGERAVELLLTTQPDSDVREVVKEPTTLVLRESTAAPR